MNYKHIQAIHELRMWIILTATGAIAVSKYLNDHPEKRELIQSKADKLMGKLKFRKEEPNQRVIKIVIVSDTEGS